MAGSVNKAIVIGRVGKDPEIRALGSSGARVANLSIATSETWRDKATGEKKEKTEWHRVSVFADHLVGVIEKYVKKCDLLAVEGKLQTRKYEKDGRDHYTTEIVLQGFGGSLTMLSGSAGQGGNGARDAGDDHDNDAGRDHDYERQTRAASAENGAGKGGGFDKRIEDDAIPF